MLFTEASAISMGRWGEEAPPHPSPLPPPGGEGELPEFLFNSLSPNGGEG